MDILSYHVFDGRAWLQADEKEWALDFHGSAAFTSAKLAQDIGEREAKGVRVVYVMGCLSTLS